jgi:hypothetical protein
MVDLASRLLQAPVASLRRHRADLGNGGRFALGIALMAERMQMECERKEDDEACGEMGSASRSRGGFITVRPQHFGF